MSIREEALSDVRRDALWKWRWLGWRRSTRAFKASIALLGILVVLFVRLLTRL